MPRLPIPGSDDNQWGTLLNEYLAVAHNADGTLKLDIKTIAALKAIDVSTLTDKQQALVAGYSAPGDGGGGQFFYDATSSQADNGGTIFAPSSGNGRWKRLFSGNADIRWFGAVSGQECTAAFTAAISVLDEIRVPAGVWIVSTLVIDKNITIRGMGRKLTYLRVTGFGTYADNKYGIVARGAATPSLTDLCYLSGMDIELTTTEPDVHGLLMTRKVIAEDLHIHGATGDGGYARSVNPSKECVYFARFTDCWFKKNLGSGFTITDTCNGIMFINCQWASNGVHGLHQKLQGYTGQNQAIYNTTLIQGQAAYNAIDGLYFQNGSNCHVYGTYVEFNSDRDGGNPKTGVGKNLRLGNVTRMKIFLGEVGTDVDPELTCAVLGTGSATNEVSIGGLRITPTTNIVMGLENVATTRTLTFNGASGVQESILFREVASDRNRIRYDGNNNHLVIEGWNGTGWVESLRATTTGGLSFFGAPATSRPSVEGAKEGNTALSSLITALVQLGLITDNSV